MRIRKDIEQESLPTCHLADLGQNREQSQENNHHSNITNEVCKEDISLPPGSFRRLYRFDLEHLDRKDLGLLSVDSESKDFSKSKKNGTNIPFPDKKSLYLPELKQFSSSHKSSSSEIKRNYYYHDDEPVLIPIRRSETGVAKQNSKSTIEKSGKSQHQTQDKFDQSVVVDLTALPWGLICQYENESFANLAANAGNLSLFIGWGAIASGVVIFVRSFFVGSMIWFNYGLPVVALGAACLFLGIILSILSDKMQHINDLKQSLTAHRILNPTSKKIDSLPILHSENGEFEDVYDRLVKLRSEINELIDECVNP